MKITFELILEAFRDYIDNSEFLDIVHTKHGYAALRYNPPSGSFFCPPDILETPEEMLQFLREEIILDVLGETDHDFEDATDDEKKEVRVRLGHYMGRLPEGIRSA